MFSIADRLTARVATSDPAGQHARATTATTVAQVGKPAADHYVVNKESGRVLFGDGASGRRPPSGPPPSGGAEGDAARELVSVRDLFRYAIAFDHQTTGADPSETTEPSED